MMMGTREIRLHALKTAAQMNKRVTKDDPVPSPDRLIEYAVDIENYIKDGIKPPGKEAT